MYIKSNIGPGKLAKDDFHDSAPYVDFKKVLVLEGNIKM